MNTIKSLLILKFTFFIFCASLFAGTSRSVSHANLNSTAAFSEEGFVFYGQKVKIKFFDVDPSKKIVTQEISGVPFGLEFDATTGLLEGIVEIEEDKAYPYLNVFKYAITYEDGEKQEAVIEIFTSIAQVDRFNLITDINGSEIATRLKDSDTINYSKDGRDLAISATGFFETSPEGFFGSAVKENINLSVDFFVNNNFFRRESIAPYALNGDISGKYFGLSLEEETYKISTRLYSKSLKKYVSDFESITVTIVDQMVTAPIINGVAGSVPRFWGDQVDFGIDVTNPSDSPLTFSIEELPEGLLLDETTGRFIGAFDLNGYNENTPIKPLVITVSNGSAESSFELPITLQLPVINSISLINAATNSVVDGFENLPVSSDNRVELPIEIANGLSSINIVANTNIGAIAGGIVDFKIDGRFVRREGVAPYALAGDISGDYLNWNYTDYFGTPKTFHNIDATVEIKKSTSLQTVGDSVNLNVIITLVEDGFEAAELLRSLTISPNPALDYIMLDNLSSNVALDFYYFITPLTNGAAVKSGFVGFDSNRIDISDLPSGMYLLNVQLSQGIGSLGSAIKFIKL